MTANTNPAPELSLPLQIEALRLQMKQQRQLIEAQLMPTAAVENAYPRSMTMRFLTQKPGIVMLTKMSALLLSARFLKTIGNTIAAVKTVYS